jgi:hypothetical protein
MVLVPLKTLQRRVTGNTRVNTLLVSMQDGSDPERVKASLTQLLRELRKLADTDEDNFNVLDTKQLADTMSGTTKVMTTLLGAVAAVSLLVGGIGIMNIMLVSVTERTREIGLRLAIGALEREVLLQFLIEAVVLAALGGLIGPAPRPCGAWQSSRACRTGAGRCRARAGLRPRRRTRCPGLHAAVDHGAGAGVAQAGVHRQAQDGAGVQLELALVLGAQVTRPVSCGRGLTSLNQTCRP